MSTFDFEEYRQPWETGPHWELKREFMEKYQNDFPKDRLLCLAQAYSNIELLNCTYPDPVMREVLNLSKSLHECKRIREAEMKVVENSSKQKKRGKRKLSSQNQEKSYFIKFCSGTPDMKSDISPSLNDTPKMDTTVLNVSPNSKQTPYSEPNIDTTESTSDAFKNASFEKLDEKHYYILNLTRSPNIGDIKTLSGHIKLSSGNPIGRLENAVSKLGFEKVRFEFSSTPTGCLCHFYVGNTLISIGRESNEKCARIKAAEYAVEILSNFENLPCKTLTDLKSHWLNNDNFFSNHQICCVKDSKGIDTKDSDSRRFWFNFSQNVTKKFETDQTINIFKKAAEELNSSFFMFAFTEDPSSTLTNRMFCCDLVLENTIICQGLDSSKKKAKSKALDNGLTCILDFNKWCEEHFQKSNVNLDSDSTLTKDVQKSDSTLQSSETTISKNSTANYSNSENETKCELKCENSLLIKEAPDFKDFQLSKNSNHIPFRKTEEINKRTCHRPFQLNHRLLQNSFQKDLALFDTSDIHHFQTCGSTLQYTASMCHKVITFEAEEINSPNGHTYRCCILFGREIIGTAEGSTKAEAKENAASYAIENLKKMVYTIKIKNELMDGFVIQRSQVTDMEFSSNSISNENIGYKLLKRLGWSGGAIGNKGGIVEPVSASDHLFHQGLGFSNKSESSEKYFKQKIDSLLRDFSRSNATGDLIFSTDFSKDERKSIHQIALRFNLVSKARGKDKDRQLFVRRKMSVRELLNLIVQAGGSTSKYEMLDCSQ